MSQIGEWLSGDPAASFSTQVGVQALHLLAGLLLVRFHGLHKLTDGLAWAAGRDSSWPLADEIESAGFPFPVLNAWLATASQLLGGTCLVLGFLTRPAAILLFATLLGAVYTNLVLRKSNQLALLYLVLVACVAAIGPGEWSMDARLFR